MLGLFQKRNAMKIVKGDGIFLLRIGSSILLITLMRNNVGNLNLNRKMAKKDFHLSITTNVSASEAFKKITKVGD
jgi:hypothetical protein